MTGNLVTVTHFVVKSTHFFPLCPTVYRIPLHMSSPHIDEMVGIPWDISMICIRDYNLPINCGVQFVLHF